MTALLTLLMACAPAEAPVPEDWDAATMKVATLVTEMGDEDRRRLGELEVFMRAPVGPCPPQPRIPDLALFAAARVEPEATLVRACYGDTFRDAKSYRILAIGARLLGPTDEPSRLRTMAFLATWPVVSMPTDTAEHLEYETALGGGIWALPPATRLAAAAPGPTEFAEYVYTAHTWDVTREDAWVFAVDASGWYMACGAFDVERSAVLRCTFGRCNYEGTGAPELLPVSFDSAGGPECVAATDADHPAPVNTLATALEKRWTPPSEGAAP